MTIPVAVLGAAKLAIAAASTVATVATAVNAQKAGNERYEQNAQAANDAYILETHLKNKQLQEQGKAVAQRKEDNSIKRLKATGTALASAAAGGVEGASVDQVLQDFRRSEGVIEDRLDQSLEAQESQAAYELLGSQAKAQSRINSIPIPDSSAVYGAAVRGAGNLVGAFSDYKDLYDGDYDA